MPIVRPLAQALYLFCPLLVAAALSAFVHRLDWLQALARPIDGGATFRGERVLGDGKTWRGLVVAVFGAVLAVLVQKHVVGDGAGWLALVDYRRANALALGAAIGAGAIAGELPNSFVKRRLGIARGQTATRPALRALFWIWDQVDLLTITWPVLALWVAPTVPLVAASVALALVLHPAVALVGWLAGARSSAR